MSKETTNKIYSKVLSGELSYEKAASLLLGELFKDKPYYGLESLSEDEFSNFLIWIHPKLIKILKNYKSSIGIFTSYLNTVIRLQRKSWKRQLLKKEARQIVLDECHDNYSIADSFSYASEEEFEYKTLNNTLTEDIKLNTTQANTLLILAMRAYPQLKNNHIKNIPKLTGISEDKFLEYLNIMRSETEKPRDNLSNAWNKLNKSYVLCKQYTTELSKMDETISQYERVEEKLNGQKILLKVRQEKMKKLAKNINPRISTIAKTLNRNPKYIYRILREAEAQVKDIKQILDPEDA